MFSVYIKNTAGLQNMTGPDLAALAGSLPFGGKERERIFAINNPARRLQSLAGLVCLEALIKKTGDKTADFEILRDENGRPFFPNLPAADFGITHTANLAAAAFCTGAGRIGIDAERIEQKINMDKIARRFFTESEQNEVFGAHGKISAEKFFLCWTKKEAAAKRDGRGLSAIAKQDIDISAIFFRSFCAEFAEERYILTLCGDRKSRGETKIFYDGEIKIHEIQD